MTKQNLITKANEIVAFLNANELNALAFPGLLTGLTGILEAMDQCKQ